MVQHETTYQSKMEEREGGRERKAKRWRGGGRGKDKEELYLIR